MKASPSRARARRVAHTRFARSPEFFGVPDEIVGKIQRKVRKNLSNQEAKVKGNVEGRRLYYSSVLT
jgi:hypothetical protein